VSTFLLDGVNCLQEFGRVDGKVDGSKTVYCLLVDSRLGALAVPATPFTDPALRLGYPLCHSIIPISFYSRVLGAPVHIKAPCFRILYGSILEPIPLCTVLSCSPREASRLLSSALHILNFVSSPGFVWTPAG
jgi:hypothetical protein